MSEAPFKPTPQQVRSAAGKTVADVIAPDLKVLFCGINPGLYTAAIGHHFGRPGNRFWPTLYAAGFTPRLLSPFEERELLKYGCGITNLVRRATAAADELNPEELKAGKLGLEERVKEYRPRCLAVLGIGAYRVAFGKPKAVQGKQQEMLYGAEVWALPNPSGLNAHYRLEDLAELFISLRIAIERCER